MFLIDKQYTKYMQWFSTRQVTFLCFLSQLKIIFHYLSQIWIMEKKVKEKKKLIQQALARVFVEKFLSFCLTFCWCSSSVEEFDWHQEELYVILLQVLVFLAREYQFSVSFNSNSLQHPPIDNPWGKRETDLIFLN